MSISLKQNPFELLRIDDDDDDDVTSIKEPIHITPESTKPTQKPKRKKKRKKIISQILNKESTAIDKNPENGEGQIASLDASSAPTNAGREDDPAMSQIFPTPPTTSENAKEVQQSTHHPPLMATPTSIAGRTDTENVDPSLPAGSGAIAGSWTYVRETLLLFNPFYSFTFDNESPDPDLNDFQLHDQSSDTHLNKSERPPAYSDTGLGTSIFSTDTGSTEVYPSGNSVIYTGTSPTIFAGSNATVITTTRPKMITQAVKDKGNGRGPSHLARSQPQDATYSRPIPPSSPETGITFSAAVTPTFTPSRTVDVKYHLRWADTEGLETVKRHLSPEKLKGIESVQRLKDDYAPNADVKVSPARSANSDTSTQVRSTYKMMLEKTREDLREDYRRQDEETERRIERKVERKYMLLLESMALVVMRNMEDYALNKMVELLPDTNRDPFHVLVKEFRKKFTIQEWCNNNYQLLANSPARYDANHIAHLDVNEPRAKRLKDGLWEYLAKTGQSDELQRYQNFYKFATGEYVAIPK